MDFSVKSRKFKWKKVKHRGFQVFWGIFQKSPKEVQKGSGERGWTADGHFWPHFVLKGGEKSDQKSVFLKSRIFISLYRPYLFEVVEKITYFQNIFYGSCRAGSIFQKIQYLKITEIKSRYFSPIFLIFYYCGQSSKYEKSSKFALFLDLVV